MQVWSVAVNVLIIIKMTFSDVDMKLCTHTPYDHLLQHVYLYAGLA